MVQDHVFPQDADDNDAENFAQLTGDPRLNDYVVQGMRVVNADFTAETFDVTEGIARIHRDNGVAASSGETRQALGFTVQLQARTGVAMLASTELSTGDNKVYLDPNLSSNDLPVIRVIDGSTLPDDGWLSLAAIDKNNEQVTNNAQRHPEGLPLLNAPVAQAYDNGRDAYVVRDVTQNADRLNLDRTTGDLKIAGQLTENASL
jgi:hypothetical protein